MTLARFSSFRVTGPAPARPAGGPSGSSRRTFSSTLVLSAAGLVIVGACLSLPGSVNAQDVGPDGEPSMCEASRSSLACGNSATATGYLSTGIGAATHADADHTVAVGSSAAATGASGIAVGVAAWAEGSSSVALGMASRATGEESVALGAGSIAEEARTVSLGGGLAGLRRIVNMADGVGDSDGATVGQMAAANAATLADANGYTDGREAAIRDDMVAGDAETLADANAYTDGREALIRSDMAAGDAEVFEAATEYTDERETVIRTDMAAGDAATLSAANTYADLGDARTLSSANLYTDQQFGRLETVMNGRFREVEVRMDQVTAMSAAFAAMSGNSAGSGTGSRNRLVVGVGNYGSETALSVGYSRAISDRTAFNAGVSFTGGEVMSGGSFGFAW